MKLKAFLLMVLLISAFLAGCAKKADLPADDTQDDTADLPDIVDESGSEVDELNDPELEEVDVDMGDVI